jgi:hypothetical protein
MPACLVLRPPAPVCAGDAETLLLAGEQAMGHAGSCLLQVQMTRDANKLSLLTNIGHDGRRQLSLLLAIQQLLCSAGR